MNIFSRIAPPPATDELARVNAISAPPKSPELIEAQRVLQEARQRRGEVNRRLVEAAAEQRESGAWGFNRNITALNAEMAEADRAVAVAREAVDRENDAWRPTIRAAMDAEVGTLQALLDDAVVRLTEIAEAAEAIRQIGVKENTSAPWIISSAPAVLQHARRLRQIIAEAKRR